MVTAINLVAAGGGVTLVPASMRRYPQECVRDCRVAGDEAFRAPLHLVTKPAVRNPRWSGSAKPCLRLWSARARTTEALKYFRSAPFGSL
ncbi:hypothetical protein M3I54_28820 [Paraburkholderia sp. CNPSo 3274]|uniref:hypothetical protein n=1 Tax=Paraburkholderia sp. CNPSo 3274 TaxID=2940932 RepID=UPI0020B720D6|nr:hypothetical protein [Paraburkholderia sp. CNPSo 3274]MCP3710931.1 hypothetical protein [Paraburkholderia sp. CNPSo 3274]